MPPRHQRILRLAVSVLCTLALALGSMQSGVRGLSRLVSTDTSDDDGDPLDESNIVERIGPTCTPSTQRQLAGCVAREERVTRRPCAIGCAALGGPLAQRLPTPPPRLLI